MPFLYLDVGLEEQRPARTPFQVIEGILEERAFQSERALTSKPALPGKHTMPGNGELRQSPSLSRLLRRAGPLSAYTGLLGVCNDGLPLFFDLSDPAPGSILIRGDGQGEIRELLRTLLVSINMLNRPEKVSYSLLTLCPEAWTAFHGDARCLGILAPGDRSAGDLIQGFAGIAAQRQEAKVGPRVFFRRNGDPNQQPAALVLVIEDLAAMVQLQTEQVLCELRWLVQHGPETGVWVVATLPDQSGAGVDPALVELFGTQVTGAAVPRFSNDPVEAGKLHAPAIPKPLPELSRFRVRSGNEWIEFSVPDID